MKFGRPSDTVQKVESWPLDPKRAHPTAQIKSQDQRRADRGADTYKTSETVQTRNAIGPPLYLESCLAHRLNPHRRIYHWSESIKPKIPFKIVLYKLSALKYRRPLACCTRAFRIRKIYMPHFIIFRLHPVGTIYGAAAIKHKPLISGPEWAVEIKSGLRQSAGARGTTLYCCNHWNGAIADKI